MLSLVYVLSQFTSVAYYKEINALMLLKLMKNLCYRNAKALLHKVIVQRGVKIKQITERVRQGSITLYREIIRITIQRGVKINQITDAV